MGRTPIGTCVHCSGDIPYGCSGNVPFCSSRCRLESQEIEYLLKLSAIRSEIQWESRANVIAPKYKRIIDIGDTHFPFVHPVKLEKFHQYHEALEPLGQHDFFIQGGDLHDRFSDTKFARTHSIYTPHQEAKLSKFMAESMWKRIRKRHPKARCIQLLGNHDERGMKRLLEKCPELEPFYNDNEMYRFDGVETVLDTTQRVMVGDIMVQHGHTQGGKHMAENLMKTISHHTHRGGVWYMNLQGFVIWELNGGYLGDPTQTPMKYTQRRWANWTHGFGEVVNDVPRFIAL